SLLADEAPGTAGLFGSNFCALANRDLDVALGAMPSRCAAHDPAADHGDIDAFGKLLAHRHPMPGLSHNATQSRNESSMAAWTLRLPPPPPPPRSSQKDIFLAPGGCG